MICFACRRQIDPEEARVPEEAPQGMTVYQCPCCGQRWKEGGSHEEGQAEAGQR